MESSDLDSLLAAAFSSDSDSSPSASAASFCRTVDDILNEGSSSSSTSPSHSPRPAFQTSEPKPPPPPIQQPPQAHNLSSASSLPALVGLRSHTTPRPLPPLFDRVRPNPRPGVALAAAAAASRPVLTPHAAAIKSRRAEASLLLGESAEVASEASAEEEKKEPGSSGYEAIVLEDIVETLSETKETNLEESAKKPSSPDSDIDVAVKKADVVAISNDFSSPICGAEGFRSVDTETAVYVAEDGVFQLEEKSLLRKVESEEVKGSSSDNEEVGEFSRNLEDPETCGELKSDDVVGRSSDNEEVGGFSHKLEYTETCRELKSDDVVVFGMTTTEDRSSKLEGNKSSKKKSDKKMKASMKPLDWAEELEKKHASSGLHWEEGAAAQPMRLKGIVKDPPAVGYMQVEHENAITRTISSQIVRTNHGSPQALAVHMGYIAVGMTKGTVLVVPSKYSARSADNMDSKMLVLGSQGERPLSPVTSLCFNLQGDLLLVGYGNGNVILWDVLKTTTAKVITGEHNCPVIHASFLAEQLKAITGDSNGFICLHTFLVVPFVNLYSVKSQYLVDGKKSETVLSISPLCFATLQPSDVTTIQGYPVASSTGIGSMMGGVVGGDGGWKLFNEGTSLMEEGVVVVTHKQALVVRLTPIFEHYDTLPRPDGIREGSIPYSSWKCALRSPSRDESGGGIPWLIIAWDRKIQVIKLVKTKLERYREWNLDSAAVGLSWLDDQMFVVLTSRGQLCLFTKDGAEIHRTSFIVDGTAGDDAIVYHSHFTNGFGNPEKAYHNSFSVRGATVYILGTSHLTTSRLLPWMERIQVLQRAGDWMSALDMSMRLYDGQVHGVIDLPRKIDDIRKMIMPYLVELLYNYVDEVFSYISVSFSNQSGKTDQHSGSVRSCNSPLEALDEQFACVGGVAVEFCLHINREDILFDDIFSKFLAAGHGGTFLEVLEPYILKDMLGCLPPEIMQALVEHYSDKGWLQRVEQCVLHMEISSLDFNQVIKLCREHGLYGALIYLFNKGLDDYKTPLEELLAVIKKLQKDGAIAIGYRMLVYLKYCFLGLGFPPGHGSIICTRRLSLKQELLEFLLEGSNLSSSSVMNTFKTTCGACPNLWYLIRFDAEAALEVLRLALLQDNDEAFSTNMSSENQADFAKEMTTERSCVYLDSRNLTQEIVNSLICCLNMESEVPRSYNIENDGSIETWPSNHDISHVVDFIVLFVSCKHAAISKQVSRHILEYLTGDALSAGFSQEIEACKKEKQVVSLLNMQIDQDWNDDYLLNRLAEAHYHQAFGLIKMIRGQYIEALESYMKDLNEPVHSFAYVHKMMLQLRGEELLSFREAVFSRLPELVKISREGAFFLVLDHFCEEASSILSKLQSNSEGLFLFLKAVVEVHLCGRLDFSAFERTGAFHDPFITKASSSSTDLEAYLERLSKFPKLIRHNPFHFSDEIAALFLELLCQYESRSVLKFLKTFDNYSLEQCLLLCQEHGITDAASFLLERAGDVAGALVQALAGLDEKFFLVASAVKNTLKEVTMDSTNTNRFDVFLSLKEVIDVHDILSTSIGLCQRNTPRLIPQESETLWFQLLDRLIEPLRKLYYDSPYERKTKATCSSGPPDRQIRRDCIINSLLKRVFSQFLKEIAEGMVGYVPVPAIMNKLLSDNGDQEFGDLKFTILGMLGTYGFERRILDTAKSLIEDDTFHALSLLKKGASHAYSPLFCICCICGCSLARGSTVSSIRIFSCGHLTHPHCESLENQTSDMFKLTGCPICMPKKKITRPRSSSTKTGDGLIQSSTFGRSPRSTKNIPHFHEPETMERPYGIQVPRFEILNSLQNGQKSLHMESIPQLRLAPPAIYHEKVQKGTIPSLLGESSLASGKSERSSKFRQQQDLKPKSLSKHLPLKATIFGSERTRSAAQRRRYRT